MQSGLDRYRTCNARLTTTCTGATSLQIIARNVTRRLPEITLSLTQYEFMATINEAPEKR